jgi:tetratricopeptide (TPR) repeat protein
MVFDDTLYISDKPTVKEQTYTYTIYRYPNIMDFSLFISRDKRHNLDPEIKAHRYMITRSAGYMGLLMRYHVVNTSIHVITALLVYAFILLTFRTPGMLQSGLREQGAFVALFSSLLFVVHPITTEAVTYLAQRFVNQAGMFYLLAMVLYVRFRLAGTGKSARLMYALDMCSALAAMTTKEMSVTLPVSLLVYELIFLEGRVGKRTLILVPFFLIALIVPIAYMLESSASGGLVEDAMRLQTEMSRSAYLFTQFRVLITYMRLLVLPIAQNVDYLYPAYYSFFAPEVFLSFLVHMAVITMALTLLYRSRERSELKLVSFGILFFYISLSMESTIFPISQSCVEYRVYLASSGASMAVVTLVCSALGRLWGQGSRRPSVPLFVPFLICIALALSLTTYNRNTVWQDETTLWEDSVSKNPDNFRAQYNLGNSYFKTDDIEKALFHISESIRLDPEFALGYNKMGLAYLKAGKKELAIESFKMALSIEPTFAEAFVNIGDTYLVSGLYNEAVGYYKKALALNPVFQKAHFSMGNAHLMMKDYEQAIAFYLQAPDTPNTNFNLGIAYSRTGRIQEAIKSYERTIELKPDDPECFFYLANAYRSEGRLVDAEQAYLRAIYFRPDTAIYHKNLGITYRQMGEEEKALEHLMIAEGL